MTEPRPRVHPILALPFLPFVLLRDALQWLGRQVGAALAAIGRFVWWLLLPVRWLCARLWQGLTWLGRRVAVGLGWLWRTVLRPVLTWVLLPFVWLGHGLLWCLERIIGAMVVVARWLWRGIGPFVVTAWRLAERMAAAVWRGLRAITLAVGRGIAFVARCVYWPFRPLVRAAATAARAVGRWCREVTDAVRRELRGS